MLQAQCWDMQPFCSSTHCTAGSHRILRQKNQLRLQPLQCALCIFVKSVQLKKISTGKIGEMLEEQIAQRKLDFRVNLPIIGKGDFADVILQHATK